MTRSKVKPPPGARKAKLPGFISPQLATLVKEPPSGDEWLHELKFDLNQVVSGFGSAPLPPVAKDELGAIGRTNDAILYGGRVIIWVNGDDDQLADIGPKVPASASPDYGAPFAGIFERYEHDFYKIDPMLFSPAEIVFCNLKSGKAHAFGRTRADVLYRSFFGG